MCARIVSFLGVALCLAGLGACGSDSEGEGAGGTTPAGSSGAGGTGGTGEGGTTALGGTGGAAGTGGTGGTGGTSDIDASPPIDADGIDVQPQDSAPPGPPCQWPTRGSTASATNQSWRWGGGHGYPDLVSPDSAWRVVTSRATLVKALAEVAPCQIIYIDDGAVIDFDTTVPSLSVPAHVWLASGRGRLQNGVASPGAILRSRSVENGHMIKVLGEDVRITGLRLWGAEPARLTEGVAVHNGIMSIAPIEVDNNDISGWSFAGVQLGNQVGSTVTSQIHHNYFRQNWREGLGYGIVLGESGNAGKVSVKVIAEHNRFEANRHSIASSGYRLYDYTARHNLVLPTATRPVFDSHGECEKGSWNLPTSPYSGGTTLVHDNIILADYHSMDIRGNPHKEARFYNNKTVRKAGIDYGNGAGVKAVRQRFSTNCGGYSAPYENVWTTACSTCADTNQYEVTPANAETNRWCINAGGSGPLRYLNASSNPMSTLAFGDFDGDGKTDVFSANGTNWRVSYGGTGTWTTVVTSSAQLSDGLFFADFDGDGKTDVFLANGTSWRYVRGGGPGAWGTWITLKSDAAVTANLGFGDFDGDGMTDVFRASGGAWSWSKCSATSCGNWAVLSNQPQGLASLRFGDFDGDGITDIFTADGSDFRMWSPKTKAWTTLRSSTVPVTSVLIADRFLTGADLDGDGKADVFRQGGGEWVYAAGGVSGWNVLARDIRGVANVALGDFDGDGKADVFQANCL